MPPTLPPVLLIRRLAQQALFTLLFGLRAIAVAVIWLAVLPWATVWTWRMYFSMGESTAWWISDRPRPDAGPETNPYFYRVTADPLPNTFVGRLTAHPLCIALSADIFTGQIIASLIVLTFVAVFLLREWISQNARPGVFEDEDVFPEEAQPQAVPQAPRPAVQRQAQPNPLDEALTRRQIETLRAIDTLRAREGINGHMVGDERHHHGRSPIERARRKAKTKEENEDPSNPFDGMRAHNRRRLYPKGLAEENEVGEEEKFSELERTKRRSFSRRVYAARLLGARRRAALTGINHPPTPMNVDPAFDFTFKAELPQVGRRSNSEPWQKQSRSTDPEHATTVTSPSTPIFPPVTLQPPRGSIPFSFDRLKTPSPLSSPTPPADEGLSGVRGVDAGMNSSSSASSLSQARRPPLPITSVGPAASFVISPPRTPLDSPNLATYRAPEELEAVSGPSGLHGYFDREQEENSEIGEDNGTEENTSEKRVTNDQMDQYFEEFDAAGGRASLPESMVYSDTDEGDENDQTETDDDSMDSDDEDDEDDEVEEEEANRLMLFNEDDWALEVQVVQQPAAGGPEEGVAAAVQEGAEAVQPPGGADLNEEVEGNVEDDMEGAMEAIGMRGPLYGVFQNAALMIFVLDTAIGLGVWIPFTIGKSTALLSLDPQRFLQILHLPIRAMRVITDPVVDTVAFLVIDLLLPPFLRLARWLVAYFFLGGIHIITKTLGRSTADGITELVTKTENRIAKLADKILEQLVAWPMMTVPNVEKPSSGSSVFSKFETTFPSFVNNTEAYFAILGRAVRIRTARTQGIWMQFALGEGPSERVFAVVLGYAVVGLLLALYLNILTVGNARSAGRAVRNAVRQQLLVLKVATFIFIELVTFPLACGVVLDLCTVWLFPEANLYSRVAFFFQAPLTAMFYHWVAGTLFMYSFAVLLSGCRAVMRSGAMWFVKDPQDQNAHPIRDILDRPTFTQLRKICVSGIMYSVVVACVVGSVAGLLLLGSKSIMPFRWKNREPLSNVPIDLLFLHLVLPHTMHYFRPKKTIKDFARAIWKFLAARLRLTSYFFGGRHPDEEYTPNHWRIFALRLPELLLDVNPIHDGCFRRVPATDHLALPRDVRATVPVTENGEPVDEAARALIALQNAEAEKAKRNPTDDYIVVYIPPHFRQRVITFVTFLWVIGAFLLGLAVALPIQLGRSFFALCANREVHDGYSFIVGFYLLWGCYLIGTAIDHLDKRRQRISGDRPRADLRVLIIKRGLLWIAKASYMVIFLGVITPTLVAFVVDLYIVLPIRFTLHPEMTPRIRVVDAWALGVLYAKIALHANRIQPPNRITTGIQHIIDNGWILLNPVQATKEVIGPVTGGLLGMIFIPGTVFRCMQYLLPSMHVDDKFIFLHVYPGIFMTAGLVRSAVILYGMLSKWSQAIRDKEFLVEMRLRNHEPEKVNVKGEGNNTPRNVMNGRHMEA